uniref:Predicted protein n=1 Tax=Hordeum vulgare subsp. vulgare TaxID=112509 RepID=F2CPU5_HORVV|nr:predicted protein [Hordeum vulgare subsp. vulgare]
MGIGGAIQAVSGGGGGGGDPGGGAGAAAAPCTAGALGSATSEESNPIGVGPRTRGAPRLGASDGVEAASRGVVTSTRTPSSAMVTASSGIAAETADGLHPATEAPESTYSMAATGYEAVAATILTDEAKEKGDKAWHLTDDKFLFPLLLCLLSLSLVAQVLITCLGKTDSLIIRYCLQRLYIVRTDATLCEEMPVPGRAEEASVEDRSARRFGKSRFPNYINVINLNRNHICNT